MKDLMQKVLIPTKWSKENCWLWLGSMHPQNGLPMYNDHQLLLSPRRLIWHAYNPTEKLEPKLSVVIPTCGIVECVNPYHLTKMSTKEFMNSDERCIEARIKKGIQQKEAFALITHCPRGHEYTAANTGVEIKTKVFNKKVKGEGYECRYCKTCKAERSLAYRNSKKLGN